MPEWGWILLVLIVIVFVMVLLEGHKLDKVIKDIEELKKNK